MIKVKHFLDEVEEDDGQRLWVEPINVTQRSARDVPDRSRADAPWPADEIVELV